MSASPGNFAANRSLIPVQTDHPRSELSGARRPAGRETLPLLQGGTNAGEHEESAPQEIFAPI